MKRFLLSLLWLIPAGLLAQSTLEKPLTPQELVQDTHKDLADIDIDLCPDALAVVCGEVITGDTNSSTAGGAPAGTCGTTSGAPGNWYSFIGTGDQIELSLCNSDYDTKIQVYSGACDALVCEGGNDDSCGLQSEFSFTSVVGTEYFFYVFGFGTSIGNYELVVTCSNIPQGCVDAPQIACGDTVTGTTTGAPQDDTPSDLCGITDGTAGVWFTITGTNELVTLSLCNSSFDTRINVYEGQCANLECLASNDDFCGSQSEVDFLSQTGFEYLIYVSGAAGESGNFELVVSCTPPPGCIDADPFCSDEGLIFENVSDDSDSQPGIDYECLFSQPNPSWFFLEIQEAGDLDLEIVQNTVFDGDGNPIGTPLDVDFIAWGPFEDVEAGCGNLNPTTSIDCSFSAAPIENFTISNAMPGELYIVLITNFDGDSGFISLGQTGGDGSTNCEIVQEFTLDLGEDRIFCSTNTPDFEITPVITGEDLGDPTFLWSTGETTETITVSTSNIYTIEVTIDGFTATEEVTITFLEEPCVIVPDCLETSFEENFGTGTVRTSTPFTQYTFNPGPAQVNDGEYAIINTSADLNTGWHDDFEDHTQGDENGRALFVNAAFAANEFYRRTVGNLLPDENYIFDSWITTVYDTDTGICGDDGIPANVTFRIEDLAGTVLSQIDTGDIPNEAAFNWQLFSIGFNSGVNTSVQIVLINNSIGGCGNDLAIDDITLSFSGTTPDIINGEDIDLCILSGTLDLTTQIGSILNGEDPTELQVTYHTSQFDAEAGNSVMMSPEVYTPSGVQTIYVRVQKLNDTSCFAVATINLIEITPTVDLGADQVICDDGSFTIVPTVSGDTANFEFLWSTGETTETITVSDSGVYTLTLTSAGGCVATDTITINLETPLSINVGEDFTTCRNFANTLNAAVSETGATFQWLLNGDVIEGANSTTLDFTSSQTAMGTQEYTLVVTSALGCTSEDSVIVSLYDVGQCVISEGLSPTNIDGFNDTLDLTFLADRTGITSLQIFNRLGVKVFEQPGYTNQWRGQTDAGNDLPTATYFYLINFNSEDPDFGNQASGWIYVNQE